MSPLVCPVPGGFKRFGNGETDISNASRCIKQPEIDACKSHKIEFIELPVAFDGLTIVINKGNTWAKQLTMAQVKKSSHQARLPRHGRMLIRLGQAM